MFSRLTGGGLSNLRKIEAETETEMEIEAENGGGIRYGNRPLVLYTTRVSALVIFVVRREQAY